MIVRRAFTLTEMLVALAVTVLALAVVTTVFSVTTKTAAVSAAIAEVENLARNFADQLEQDLKYCDPSRSVLVIVGRTQAAALTEEARQAGQYYRVFIGDPENVPSNYDPRFDSSAPGSGPPRDEFSDPRADILMFFTERPTVSKAPATATGLAPGSFQEKLQQGTKVWPIQVVYGHAALDKAVRRSGTWDFADNLQHIEEVDANGLSVLPAKRWHLARRAALLEEPPSGWSPANGFRNDPDEFNSIVRCYGYDPTVAADSVRFSLQDYLRLFAPGYNPWDGGALNRALYSPYRFSSGGSVQQGVPWSEGQGLIWNVLYPNGITTNHHVATVIEEPPAALQDNLGLHLLPGCVWFQVEFLLPEDPRNGLEHPLSDQRRDTPRWVAVDPGQTYVFVPDTVENRQLVESRVYTSGQRAGRVLPNPNRLRDFAQVVPPALANQLGLPQQGDTVDNRRVRLWPYAIRVTVRVFDQRGRLEEPVVRTVVHRFE
jgi:prepilin-type N-terminal cleavage/methylation domain-containing protein